MAAREAIGVVGIGAMGLPIALRLADGGHTVRVRDIDAARERLAAAAGCGVAAQAAVLAAGCALVVVVVVDAEQVNEVLFGAGGLIEGLARRSAGSAPLAVMLCPTIAPEDVQAAASALAERGCEWLEAPMSGGPQRAREGTMSLMVASPESAWQRWHAVLERLAGPRLFRIGERAGDGARTKLVNNLLAAINLAGAAEGLALAEALGLDPARTLDVIEQSSGQSWIGSERLRRALRDDDSVQARMALLAKDSALALASAARVGRRPQLGGAAAAIFARACGEGLAEADDSVLWRWLAGRG